MQNSHYRHSGSHSRSNTDNHQFSSVTQLCLTLCDPKDCNMPGFPVIHHLPKFAQVHVHCVGDAIQPSHLLMPSSPFAFSLWSFSFSISPSMSIQVWFPLRLTGLISLQSKGLSGVYSSTTVWRHQFFGTLPSLQSNFHSRMWPLGRP